MVENVRRSGELQDLNLASRKAEESALRRYQAIHWLECFVGPLGIPSKPSESEFISCLRNGIILCNVINKIQPGRIPKVVDNNEPVASELSIWDSKPLPAYQYFENVRNFLMAVKELKLPAFEASDLERENFEAEAAARIVDCILALKSYHEWKEWSGGNGVYKHVTVKSPVALQSASKNFGRSLTSFSAQPCRLLEMSPVKEKQSLTDSIVKAFTNHMVNSKENIHNSFLSSLKNGSQDSVQLFTEILSRCLEEKLRDQSPMLKTSSQDSSGEAVRSSAPLSVLLEILSPQNKREMSNIRIHHLESLEVFVKGYAQLVSYPSQNILQCYGAQTRKGDRDHWRLLQCQEKDLSDIKSLWYNTKEEFEDMQTQILNDLLHIGSLVAEMSAPALAYQKVVQENRKLYNLAQDLKGNVRVYCRIRPIINAEAKNVVDFVGQDGSLVIVDPSKPRPEGRKVFQFNQVYGPTAKQDEVFKEIQPLIRSVMDGYNVCIMAYGQTGSGKTHTMFGSSSVSEKEMGINYFALNDLFKTAGRRSYANYDVRVQMVRICNEQIQDLLVEDPLFHNDSSLLDGAFHSVKSYVDAINLVKLGERMHILKMNNLTNHSHSVITIQVHGKDTSGNILHGSLYMVDLAASEEDNPSLSCLEELITSFSQKSSSINQRSSKITSILQDVFGGNAKVVVFAHVNPEGENFIETVNTLRFTQKISTIDLGAAVSNKKSIEVMELKQEIELLKCALGDKDARSPQPNRKLILSSCDKTRLTMEKSPVKARRLNVENPGSMKSEKRAKSPLPRSKATENSSSRETEKISDGATSKSNEPFKSPVKKQILQGSFPRSQRLSIENPESIKHDKLVKSPIGKQKPTENVGTGKSEKLSDGTIGRSKDPPKSPSEKPMIEGSFPRSRRLSIENTMVVGSEKKQKLKEPKSPSKEQISLKRKTPPKTRRQSIENPNSMKPVDDIRKSSNISQTSICLESPKNFTKEQLHSTNVVINSKDYISIMECPKSTSAAPPTFTDCATKYPSFKPPKTTEQQPLETNDLQTPDVGKSTTHKESQIKRSLRTIGKLINGSEKRNQQKVESSSSTKGKGSALEPKSPPTAKAKALRRRSLTAIPAPPGLDRISSLGGSSTDARSSDRRNAKSPPSVRSSTKITGRWM